MAKHNDDDPVMVGFESSRNISMCSDKGGEELGITWGDWRAMTEDQRTAAVAEFRGELIDVWVEVDEDD